MAPTSLDPNADTEIRIIQRGPVEPKQTDFKILAAAVSPSPYLKAFLRHMNGASGFRPNKTHIEDTGITVAAVEIVLRGMHLEHRRRKSHGHSPSPNNGVQSSTEGQVNSGAPGFDAATLGSQPPANVGTSDEAEKALPKDDGAVGTRDPVDMDVYFPSELQDVGIDDIWGVLALLNLDTLGKKHRGKFDVGCPVVQEWFLKWREANFPAFNTQVDFEKLLFPTLAFDDSLGFRLATKWLGQNTGIGNISEYSPFVHSQGTEWYLHLRLPAGVMSRIRIARSQLRTRVSEQVWSVIRGRHGWLLHSDKCSCWIVAHYNYQKALEEAGVLCPELDHKKTIMELVERMETVEYEEPLNACVKCSNANITTNLRAAVQIGSAYEGITIPYSLTR